VDSASRATAPRTPPVAVRGETDRPAFALLPQLDECGREQRQRAGFLGDLEDERVDERWINGQAGPPRWTFDSAAVLIGGHRADQHMGIGEHRREAGICRATAVEVGTNRGDDRGVSTTRRAFEDRDEAVALGLIGRGEKLLEFVHDDQRPGFRWQGFGGRAEGIVRVRVRRNLRARVGWQRRIEQAVELTNRMSAGAHDDPRPRLSAG
jgi:hypothetical protein